MEVEVKSAMEVFLQVWNFQLFAVDGSAVTLGKIIIGLVLLVSSYFAARHVSRYLGRRLLARLNLQTSLEYSLERLSFYAIYIFFILFILQMLSIPITIFTLLGSALAIGIGFGSQNLVNNFISGLIVMVEQPVRVGDWVELEEVFGRVEHIGARCTYIRRLDNKQTIVPNSNFLEKIFVNWTLTDQIITSKIQVGVAYGSDLQMVKSLLLQAAQEHPAVQRDPGPSVAFIDFGNSSLDFSLYFTLNLVENSSPLMIASEIRFRINELFRNHQINIPFPHREFRFSPDFPVSVRIETPVQK